MFPWAMAMALALTAAAGDSPDGREPFQAQCRPVLGQALRPGSWGLVSLDVSNRFAGPLRPGLGQEVRGAWHAVRALPELAPGERRTFLVPFRPMPGASAPEAFLDGRARKALSGLVGPEDARVAALVGRLDLPSSAPAGFTAIQAAPEELPAYPSAYEGIDVLVIGELDAAAIAPAQRQALRS
ncbi:MAG TPA: hypothetical protein PK280_14795 [Planctomycetota bacterium]|nr:hypothetical protein [Planctomycetota bacterium]